MIHNLSISSLSEVQPLIDLIHELSASVRVFAFSGEMGAGKTTFIKAICAGLGVDDHEMSSPSFAIVNEYQSPNMGEIYHFDLYRIEDPSELIQIGWDDYLMSNNLIFIEWPEMAKGLIPEDAAIIRISHDSDSEVRTLQITTP